MQFIHQREYLNDGDYVQINCDTKSNIMLTIDNDFDRFKRRESFEYFGGHYERFPVRLYPKYTGYWNITIDLGEGYEANIRYSINVFRVSQ